MKNYGHVLVAVVTTSSTYMAKTRHLSDMPQTQTQTLNKRLEDLPAQTRQGKFLIITWPLSYRRRNSCGHA